ncbi:MAG: hypothetical protein AAGJ68_05650, partial [Pseudomonadota bacterium]
SSLQHVKLREIDKKARGKAKSGFGSKGGFKRKTAPRVRQIDEDIEEAPPPARSTPQLVRASEMDPAPPQPKTAPPSPKGRPKFKVIEGGADKN